MSSRGILSRVSHLTCAKRAPDEDPGSLSYLVLVWLENCELPRLVRTASVHVKEDMLIIDIVYNYHKQPRSIFHQSLRLFNTTLLQRID